MSFQTTSFSSGNALGDDFFYLDRVEPGLTYAQSPSSANFSAGGILDTVKDVGGSILGGLGELARKGLEILTEPEVIAAGVGIADQLIRQRLDIPPNPRPVSNPGGPAGQPTGGYDPAPQFPQPNAGDPYVDNYDARSPIPVLAEGSNGMDSMVLIIAVGAAAFILLMD